MTFKEEIYNNFVNDFSINLREKISDLEVSEMVFLCIGTDRITGDCFGPLVGYKLKHLFKNEKNIKVIGSLDDTICTQNILNVISDINNKYDEPFLIAIDAALSNKRNIGEIIVTKESMNVGSSLNKEKIYVGDLSIKGIVAKDFKRPQYNFKLLQNTPFSLIMDMADCVSQGIYNVINV